MTRFARLLNILIRVFALGALSLGLAFWFGYAWSLTRLHIGFGTGLVICLWLLAGIVWRNVGHNGLVAFAAAWGLVIWLFGFAHGRLLPGPGHWMAAAAHLALGVLTIAIGRQLAIALAHGPRMERDAEGRTR
jgi:hypothetical protein